MTTTVRLGLTDLEEGGIGYTTVNLNQAIVDALVMGSIKDRDLSTPPGSPSEGDRYLVLATGTGAWATHDGQFAVYINSTWYFVTPSEGWILWVDDENCWLRYNGSAWIVDSALVKAISILNPTASENATLFYTTKAITVTKLVSVLQGSSTPSVTWTIRFDSDRSATGTEVVTGGTTTTNTSTGTTTTSFNDATIPANSFVWMKTTAQSGTVSELSVTMEYLID